ncbi:MAG: DUF547 domain-containing protein [Deltaproteobacteria bacterium]|jgi:hypothetical protein|nr:DUF547 domain-containing protein [Deltaproteobacteria bacterium]
MRYKAFYCGLIVFLCVWSIPLAASGFDHSHKLWNQLLSDHVRWNANGTASQVDYLGFAQNRPQLTAYLDALSEVTLDQFDQWSRNQQLAFLINAYNAFTIDLILTEYPYLNSIKELGAFFSSPWERKFFYLLDEKRYLDDIEHNLIRGSGRFNEPLIHFAVNCASVGCPALRDEAYVAAQLNPKLLDSTRRFLQDRSRNHFDAVNSELNVSSIFDWYSEDFAQGWRGYHSLIDFFRTHADWIADGPNAQAKLKSHVVKLDFLDYDWSLNDLER